MIPSENKIFIKINGQTKDLVNFMTIKFGKDKTEYFLSQYKSFLSNLRLKSDMTYEELIVVANKNAYRILNNSLSDNTTYSENMPHSFKERYPRMFLPENTPINIKILFITGHLF